MQEIINSVDQWALVKLFGGFAFILSALVSFIAILIRDIFLKKKSHQQDIEIEKLKNKLIHNEGIINKLQDTHSKVFLSSSTKRISSIEILWKGFIEIRKNIPSSIMMANSILTKEEYHDLETTMPHLHGILSNSLKEDEIMKKHHEIIELVELQRPFIGEKLWNIFYVNQILHGRLVYLFFNGKENRKYKHWTDDNGTLSALKQFIPAEDLSMIINNSVLAYTHARSYLELKISSEISALVSGKAVSENILENSINMAKSLNDELSHKKIT